MITFACPKCGMAYREPDTGTGRKFFCTNPNCGQKVQVPSPQDQHTEPGIPLESPRLASSKSGEWFYEQNGLQQGPVTLADLKHLAKSGNLLPGTRLWTKGMSDWQAAEKAIPALFAKPKRSIDEESVELGGGDRAASRWESIGFALFALVAAGILAALAYVLIPKIRGKSDETKQEQVNQPVTPPVAFRDWSEIHKKCEPSVALIRHNSSSGSGFLIQPGVLVTNSRVIAGDVMDNISITFPSDDSDRSIKGELIYEDRKRDLAIIRIRSSKPALKLASTEPAEGKPLATIGSTGTLAKGGTSKNSIRDGILNKVVQLPDGQTYYETSVTLNEGNSGGPMLNSDGDAIGVAQSRGQLGRNLFYAIPLLDLRHALEKAEATKKQDAAGNAAEHDFIFACNYFFGLVALSEAALESHIKNDMARRNRLRNMHSTFLRQRKRIVESVEANPRVPADQKTLVRDLSRRFDDIETAYLNAIVGNDAMRLKEHRALTGQVAPMVLAFRTRYSNDGLLHVANVLKEIKGLEGR